MMRTHVVRISENGELWFVCPKCSEETLLSGDVSMGEPAAEVDMPTFGVEETETHMSFRCPKCGRRNIHGRLGGYGHRVSHCECWPRGYFLRPG